jgi:hypothetical protein
MFGKSQGYLRMQLEGVGKPVLLLENGPLTACAFQEASDNQPEFPQETPPPDSLKNRMLSAAENQASRPVAHQARTV